MDKIKIYFVFNPRPPGFTLISNIPDICFVSYFFRSQGIIQRFCNPLPVRYAYPVF